MTCKSPKGDDVSLLHSIHDTGNPKTKVALAPTSTYEAALDQFASLHSGLMSAIASEFHGNVFVDTLPAGLIGQQIDSTLSCNCSAYADELLTLYNPQDGDAQSTSTKRSRTTLLTYSAAVSSHSHTHRTPHHLPIPAPAQDLKLFPPSPLMNLINCMSGSSTT